jgi:hypothetical protein
MNYPRGTSTIPTIDRSVARSRRHGAVHSLSILLLAFLLVGCTTLRPIDVDAVTLHQKIRSGEAVQEGDTIRAITIDGVAHRLYVTAVDENIVMGHPPGAAFDVADTVLPVDDIVLVEVSRLSADNPRRFAVGTGIGIVVGLIIFAILI